MGSRIGRWGDGEIGGWGERAQKGFLASGIDPADRKGHKNLYIDLLQKKALAEVLDLTGEETVLDFGCGSGRISHWIAPRVKKVIGLEVTPGMIELAEKNRTSGNVEFILYDGVNFPVFPFLFDLLLSIGVLQIMRGEVLKNTVSHLANYLKKGGKGYFIEQVSDNPKMGRPKLADYLQAFQESGLECLQSYPIRKGRSSLLYLIRYGVIPKKWFPSIAHWELKRNRKNSRNISYYQDYLFLLRRK
ncbi:MAG: class I SAM-dependent methyltransferase [Deltaproteobacteria bacterium]|nr:class I SAM-dependent methyltransferase [Deltaproteobacteria bacterium]